jgi:Flp pilus assembly protein TadG
MRRASDERGDGLIEGLLMFGLLLAVIAIAVQAIGYAHARSVATAAAQEGARAAATGDPRTGRARAEEILSEGGSAAADLRANVTTTDDQVTVSVDGPGPHVFGTALAVGAVHAQASLPLERYPDAETAAR